MVGFFIGSCWGVGRSDVFYRIVLVYLGLVLFLFVFNILENLGFLSIVVIFML